MKSPTCPLAIATRCAFGWRSGASERCGFVGFIHACNTRDPHIAQLLKTNDGRSQWERHWSPGNIVQPNSTRRVAETGHKTHHLREDTTT